MYGTIERRQLILNVLCERRTETIDNLAFEFSVHRNTIKKDIEQSNCSAFRRIKRLIYIEKALKK